VAYLGVRLIFIGYPEFFARKINKPTLAHTTSTPPEKQTHAAHSKGGEGLLFCL
jgi:hypothetical protein